MDVAWVPLGYMLKRVATAPAWLGAPEVSEICAVSGCISGPFADYIAYWRHNGRGLFDDAATLEELARSAGCARSDLSLFYYEAWPEEYDEHARAWRPLRACETPARVQAPEGARRLGYDVVTWSTGSGPECSPLSCNRLAAELKTNPHCLFDDCRTALEALSSGRFDRTEPGPFRIVAVHAIANRQVVGRAFER